jgi:hypothetical protein
MIVEPANPIAFTEEDFEPLREALAADGIDARLALRPERGYGGALGDVFHVFIEHRDEIKQGLDITKDTILSVTAVLKVVQWLKGRWDEDHEEHPENPRDRILMVYRIDSEVLNHEAEAEHLATIRLELPNGEPTIETNGTPSRKPPRPS